MVDCIVHQSIMITKDLSNGPYDAQRISVMEGMTHNNTSTPHLFNVCVCKRGGPLIVLVILDPEVSLGS